MGFEINPYDSCIANKTINERQCTIAWYVNDMKISHVDKDVVTQVIQTEAEYVACSEVVKELLFIVYLLRHMKIEVELPIRVNVDNIGAIFLAENQNSSDKKNTLKYVIILFANTLKMEQLR